MSICRCRNSRATLHRLLIVFIALLFLSPGVIVFFSYQSFIEQISPVVAGYQARHPTSVSAERAAELTYGSIVVGAIGASVLVLLCLHNYFRKAMALILPPCAIGLFLTALAAVYVYMRPDSGLLRSLYREDGPLETFTAALFLIAAVLFGRAAWVISKYPVGKREGNKVWAFWCCVFLATGSFVLGMEEISWGQRFFGWQTPARLAQINVQQETNVHNFFNEDFERAYRLLMAAPLFVLVSIGLRRLSWVQNSLLFYILPRYDMAGLAILIGGLAILMPYPPTELLEELVAVFAIFYSAQTMYCLRLHRTCQETVGVL